MRFIADFHIHSHFSRSTAKNLDLENLYIAAQLKGITVIGTGDVTHPGWFAEIKEKLIPAEPGLFKLKEDIANLCDQRVPLSCRGKVRFILVSEISNIYKKNDKTRKNHNLVFLPNLDLAENFNSKLDKIGNIKSDGRPILGLDARNLLEILLETSDEAFLIPAHIWTPWFSLLGSKSGFNSIEECFEDLSSYIFAVETGLSSDPVMNWRVSSLDKLTLVSNSDAHSPLKLGREANIFNTTLSYLSIKKTIEKGDPESFLGTYEFYPEEGKYHIDGHRKCDVSFWPEQTRNHDGKCPVCGKPLTLGVLYRVEELSDRMEGEKPEKALPFFNIIPLTEILSDVLQVGSGSKKVMKNYMTLLEKLGPELEILNNKKKEEINSAGVPLLGEAILKMRQNKIVLLPGYDGEYGKIKIFDHQERKALLGQKELFFIQPSKPDEKKKTKQKKLNQQKLSGQIRHSEPVETVLEKKHIYSRQLSKEKAVNFGQFELNKEQSRAVKYEKGPLIIVAGPGTGKTRTLTHRIAHLVSYKKVLPENILAVTFTNKAAQEMRHRLTHLIKNSKQLPFIGTFHSFCLNLLNDHKKNGCVIIDEYDQKNIISDVIKHIEKNGHTVTVKPKTLLDWIASAKQRIKPFEACADEIAGSEKQIFLTVIKCYQKLLSIQGLYDYEDLIYNTVLLFEKQKDILKKYRERYKYVFVDEYQDLNHGQYRLLNALVPPGRKKQNICVIGDPDQLIYGFRGSDVTYFNTFIRDYPDAEVFRLTQNYRSTQTILDASYQVISAREKAVHRSRIYSTITGVKTIGVIETGSGKSEAVAVGKIIEKLIGGTGFHFMDYESGAGREHAAGKSFSDFAVLYRTAVQQRVFSEIFDAAGIPYQVVSKENIYHTKNIKELLSLFKIIEGSGCFVDFERIIKLTNRPITGKVMEIFKNWSYKKRFTLSEAMDNARKFPVNGMGRARQVRLNDFLGDLLEMKKKIENLTVEKKLVFLMKNTGLSEAINNNPETKQVVTRLIDISRTLDVNTAGFFTTIALNTDTDTYDHGAEKVSLMTMHTAKGLEFPVVFVVGCENGYLPFQRSDVEATDMDEERRLFYVSMTRAREQLYVTFAKKRKIYGKTKARTVSPFIGEIENRLKMQENSISGKKRKNGPTQLKLF
jgi:DNA helicase II / ATP-dependent DNA helicase PcrA